MAPFSYKLCWLHNDYTVNFGASKCQNSSSIVDSSSTPVCHNDCALYVKCKRAFELAGLPNNFWYGPDKMRVATEDVEAMATTQHIRRNIKSFVKNGQNLWICSDTQGNGKTYRAVTLACTYILHNVINNNYFDNMVRYVYIPKYVSDYEIIERYSFENEKRTQFLNNLESLYTSDLVIWDDLGYGSESRIESVILRAIINDRLNNNKSNIFISGKPMQQISTIVGRSLYDRIYGSSLLVNFRGPDMRTNTKYAY